MEISPPSMGKVVYRGNVSADTPNLFNDKVSHETRFFQTDGKSFSGEIKEPLGWGIKGSPPIPDFII